jgi:hypothetical protein
VTFRSSTHSHLGRSCRRVASNGIAAAIALTVALTALPLGLSAGAQGSDMGKHGPTLKAARRHSHNEANLPAMLVFPPDAQRAETESLVDVMTDVSASRLEVSNSFRSVLYARSLPTIIRGLADGSLTSDETRGPFDDNTKAAKLARLMSYPYALVLSIDDYQYDSNKNQVSLVLSARLLDLHGKGLRVVRAVTLPGKSPETAQAGADEETLATDLTRKLSEELMTQVLKSSGTLAQTTHAKLR